MGATSSAWRRPSRSVRGGAVLGSMKLGPTLPVASRSGHLRWARSARQEPTRPVFSRAGHATAAPLKANCCSVQSYLIERHPAIGRAIVRADHFSLDTQHYRSVTRSTLTSKLDDVAVASRRGALLAALSAPPPALARRDVANRAAGRPAARRSPRLSART